MSIAFLLNPGYNTINNVHHTFWDQGSDNIKNTSLNQDLAVTTAVSAPVHNITSDAFGTAKLYWVDGATIGTDAPSFSTGILKAGVSEQDIINEQTLGSGVTFGNDVHLGANSLDTTGDISCGKLTYTSLDPPVTPGDPSTWSDYPAISDANLDSHSLNNVDNMSIASISATGLNVQFSSNIDMNGHNLINTKNLALRTTDPSIPVIAMQYRYTADDVYNRIDFLDPFSVVDGRIGFAGPAPTATNWDHAGNSILTSTNNRIVNSGSTFVVSNPGSAKALVRNNSGAVSFNSTFDPTTPTYLFGTAGQLLSSGGSSAPPEWVDAPTATDWSSYPATSSVTDLTTLIGTSTVPGEITEMSLALGNFSVNNILDASFIGTGPNKSLVVFNDTDNLQSFSQLQLNTQNSGCSLFTNSYPEIHTNGEAFSNTPGATALSCSGDLVLRGSTIRIARDVAHPSCLSINNVGALSFNTAWTGDSPNPITEGSYGDIGQILSSNGDGAAPEWIDVVVPTSSEKVFYVSNSNGSDTANGTVNYPFASIAYALSMASALYPDQVVILIAPGVYSETSLAITTPNISLVGYSPSAQQNLLTQIIAPISITIGTSQDLYYSQIGLYNLQISGSISDTSSAVHTLNIKNVRISGDGNLIIQNSSSDSRTYLDQVVLLHGRATASTDPLLWFRSGTSKLSSLDVTARDNCPVLQFDGTAKLLLCGLSTFESTTSSSSASPIVVIKPDNGGPYPQDGTNKAYAFGYCSFSYTSPTAKTNSPGILCQASAGHPILFVAYNTFNLTGCVSPAFAIKDYYKTTNFTLINFFSNSSVTSASGIDSNTKQTLYAVA